MRIASVLVLVATTLAVAQNKPTIAVLELTGTGVASAELTALTNRLRLELFQTGKFTVVERGQMETVLAEQGFQQTGCTDATCAVEVGQLLNVEAMVLGSVDRVGSMYSVNVRLVGVGTGEITHNVTSDCVGCTIESLMLTGIGKAARQLAGLEAAETVAVPAAPVRSPSSSAGGRVPVQHKAYSGGDAGSLAVTAAPAGAEVWVDGVMYGTGNLLIEPIAVGNHSVTVTKAGHRARKEDVSIGYGTITNVVAQLRPRVYFRISPTVGWIKKPSEFSDIMDKFDSPPPGTVADSFNVSHEVDRTMAFGTALGVSGPRHNYFGIRMDYYSVFEEGEFDGYDTDKVPYEVRGRGIGIYFDYYRTVVDVKGILQVEPGLSIGYGGQKIDLEIIENQGDFGWYHLKHSEGGAYPGAGDKAWSDCTYIGGPHLRVLLGWKRVFVGVEYQVMIGRYGVGPASPGRWGVRSSAEVGLALKL